MIACDPAGALWHPSGPMGPPSDRKEPGAGAESLHSGPARRTWALVGPCVRALHNAMRPEPARAPPWLPAARQVPLGPLDTAPPLVDLALAVSALAGARRAKKAKTGPKHDFLRSQVKTKGRMVAFGGFLDTLRGLLGDGEARVKKIFCSKTHFLARAPKKCVFEQNIFFVLRASPSPRGPLKLSRKPPNATIRVCF